MIADAFAPRSAAELYALACAEPPCGRASPEDAQCALCGRDIAAGELVMPITAIANPMTFTKWGYLAYPSSPVACGHCAATSGDAYQSGAKRAKSFACSAGVFPLHRGLDVARFVRNPPTPPFAAVFSTRQKQAMVFRTPLNWNRDYIVLRFDDELLGIRTARACAAARAWREIIALVTTKFGTEPALNERIGVLSMTLEAADLGMLFPPVVARVKAMGRQDLLDAVSGLSLGESWALACLVQLPDDDLLDWREFGQSLP